MSRPNAPLTVWDGVAITLGVLSLLALFGVALATPHFEAMFKDMGNAQLPALTRFVLARTIARHVVPIALLIGFVATFVWRPPAAVRVGLVLLTAALAAVWLFALYQPVFGLAGNISE